MTLLLWVCACVEPFNLKFKSQLKILTIEATITDTELEQTVKITESINNSGSTYASPVTKATVEILVNGSEKISLIERSGGIYVLPASFRTRLGSTYKLFFQKSDGTKYESGIETQSTAPEITKVYDEFKIDGIGSVDNYAPANYVYIDTQDPADQKNNYLWSWKLWERQNICASCMGGRFFLTPAPGACRQENAFLNTNFDYTCNGSCWDIFYNRDLNVANDIYSNGKPIIGKLIGKIPFYLGAGALIEITQQTISAEAYRYFKLLADQVQNNGSLVDTPPAAIIGNIKNMANPDEPIAGFFMVTSVRTVRYWLSRENGIGKVRPIGLLGHPFNPEPQGADTSRPPLAPCLEGKFRTPKKPTGWID